MKFLKKLFTRLFYIAITCIIIASWLGENDMTYFGTDEQQQGEDDDDLFPDTAHQEYDSVHPCNTVKELISHRRKWEDYNYHHFKGSLSITTQQACKAEEGREEFPYPSDYINYWGIVYKHLVDLDYAKMPQVYAMFQKIGKQRKLNYADFANMVVSFVQDIPYVLVHPNSCETYAQNGGFARQYHEDGGECLPSKKYGIQSPSEFMFNFKGDCDTRAVFAYTVLAHFGYDVTVFCSERHAMLGIHIPATGTYLSQYGKKYYFWETTAKGWVIGVVPPEYQNDNWKICLQSINQT